MPSETASTLAPAFRAKDRLDARSITLIIALSACWGFTQVTVKIANAGMQPVFQAGIRSVIACVLVFLWCWWRKVDLFERDGTLWAGLAAGLLFAIEFLFIYTGLDFTSVSRSVLFVYLMPFVVAIGAHFFIPNERLTVLKLVGMIAAFGGIVFVLSDDLSLPSQTALIGDLLCFLGAVAWGATTIVIKSTKLSTAQPEKVLVYQLVISAVVLTGISPLFGPILRDVSALTITAVVYQGIVVVAISYLVWFWLLRNYPAADLATFTFLTPVFGLISGALILSEPVGPKLLVALALLAIGLFLVAWRPRGAAALTPPAAGG